MIKAQIITSPAWPRRTLIYIYEELPNGDIAAADPVTLTFRTRPRDDGDIPPTLSLDSRVAAPLLESIVEQLSAAGIRDRDARLEGRSRPARTLPIFGSCWTSNDYARGHGRGGIVYEQADSRSRRGEPARGAAGLAHRCRRRSRRDVLHASM
jgi:hypothetical protein